MIRTSWHDRLLTITLDRPDKRNALNREMVERLREAFREAERPDVKTILLRAEGPAFSAGADLDALKRLRGATDQENQEDSNALASLFLAMVRHPKPIVARIHGDAIAGGCGLATACDIRVASASARFGYTEARIGFVPAMVAMPLLRAVGETQARRLLMGADLIDAWEARGIGLVSEAVDADRLDERVAWWTDRLTHDVSGSAVARTKALLSDLPHLPISTQFEAAAHANALARRDPDCVAGVDRFLDKETPRW
jgi:methylglutaconyl-CoA hydratase